MTEHERSTNYVLKRAQAQRNAGDHITDVLWKSAEKIVKSVRKYRPYYQSKVISDPKRFEKEAVSIVQNAEREIERYIEAYAKASVKVLKMDSYEAIESYLKQNIFGKTYKERNSQYLLDFAEDIIRLVKAGVAMRYDEKKLINAVRSSYKDPYVNSIMTKAANEEKMAMVIPHRGQGIYAASYENIIRNAKNTINMAWGMQEIEYAKLHNAIAYRTYRNSSYPCDICDEIASRVHDISEGMLIPAHHRCVCGVEFIYKKEK